MEEFLKTYIRPAKILAKSSNVIGEEYLFTNSYEQIFLTDKKGLYCQGRGYIILDFGYEIAGGIRVLHSYIEGQKSRLQMRVRFGESLGEVNAEIGEKNATNDHAVRDRIVDVPDLSDFEIGDSGFRFVRLDFLTDNKIYLFKSIVAYSKMRNLPLRGKFACNDEMVNRVFDTSCRTIHLCSQQYIWDGVKRDRLVWIGDMQPEVLGATYLFGPQDFIKKSILVSEANCPLPDWFGSIPIYSAWYLQIVVDYYLRSGDEEFLTSRLPYMKGVISQFDDSIAEDGHIDYGKAAPKKQRGYFIDWPSSESPNLEEGDRYLLIYVFENVSSVLAKEGMDELLKPLLKKLYRGQKKELLREKQLAAFQALSKRYCVKDVYPNLIDDGGKGLSTYMSYFILKAIAQVDAAKALEIMKEYYGGMLNMGATSFWEDFDLDWMKDSCRLDELPKSGQKDIHGDHGKYCYKGFRHSLCHGWSCGPIQFLLESIAGLEILEPGYAKVQIKPNLGNLKWVKASVPTPKGDIIINVENGNTNIHVPDGIVLVD